MGILKRSVDLVYTFRFLKLLTTPFEKTDAYAQGIIDKDGKRTNVELTSEMKSSYTMFHRLVFNIKKLMAKVPGGSSQIASYASALYLVKEHLGNVNLDKILEELNISTMDLQEENSAWFRLSTGELAPGIYKVMNEKVLNDTGEPLVFPRDKIRVNDNSFPVGSIYGVDIYEAVHLKTMKKIYVTIGELQK